MTSQKRDDGRVFPLAALKDPTTSNISAFVNHELRCNTVCSRSSFRLERSSCHLPGSSSWPLRAARVAHRTAGPGRGPPPSTVLPVPRLLLACSAWSSLSVSSGDLRGPAGSASCFHLPPQPGRSPFPVLAGPTALLPHTYNGLRKPTYHLAPGLFPDCGCLGFPPKLQAKMVTKDSASPWGLCYSPSLTSRSVLQGRPTGKLPETSLTCYQKPYCVHTSLMT